jgi:hypothetical protein
LKRPTDTPIDPDATEKIEPQRMVHAHRPEPRAEPRAVRAPRNVREVQGVRNVDPRREASTTPADDEAPTTLFDRRSLKPAASQAPTRHTTERSPAPPSREEAPESKPVPRAPRRS